MKPTCHECIEVKEIVKKKCMVQAALVLLLVLCFSCAAAQEAKDLTNACIISSPDKTTDKVHDGAYTISGKAVQTKSPIWSSKRLKERARSIFISVLPRCRRHGALKKKSTASGRLP